MPKPCDDRENPCGIAQLSAEQIGWRALGLQSVTKDPIVKREQSATAVRETTIALGGGVVGWVFWHFMISPITKPLVDDLLNILFMAAFSIIVAMVFWYFLLGWMRRGLFTRIAEIFLSEGKCASCGYSLDDLITESDGCVVCPECNAAWKKERVGNLPISGDS